MRLAVLLHLFCIGAWVGCVLVEGLYEHSIDSSPALRKFVSKLHWNTDKYVEVPALAGVLLTGAWLLFQVTPTALVVTKVVIGLIAIALNGVCVWLVFRRLQCSSANDFRSWERLDNLQHKLGALVSIAILIALAIGIYLQVSD